jgi:hypothetical protein
MLSKSAKHNLTSLKRCNGCQFGYQKLFNVKVIFVSLGCVTTLTSSYERRAYIHNCVHAAITVHESTGSRSKFYALLDHRLFEKHSEIDHSLKMNYDNRQMEVPND